VTSEPPGRIRWERSGSGAGQPGFSGRRLPPVPRAPPRPAAWRGSGHHAEVPPGEGERLLQTFLQVGAPARRDAGWAGGRGGEGAGWLRKVRGEGGGSLAGCRMRRSRLFFAVVVVAGGFSARNGLCLLGVINPRWTRTDEFMT